MSITVYKYIAVELCERKHGGLRRNISEDTRTWFFTSYLQGTKCTYVQNVNKYDHNTHLQICTKLDDYTIIFERTSLIPIKMKLSFTVPYAYPVCHFRFRWVIYSNHLFPGKLFVVTITSLCFKCVPFETILIHIVTLCLHSLHKMLLLSLVLKRMYNTSSTEYWFYWETTNIFLHCFHGSRFSSEIFYIFKISNEPIYNNIKTNVRLRE